MCNEREQVAFFLVSDHINIHIHIFIQNIDTHVHTQVQYIYTHGSDDTWSGGVCVPDEQTGLFVLRAQHEILWPTNPSTYIYIYCITAMDNTNTAAYGGGTFCFSRSLALTL